MDPLAYPEKEAVFLISHCGDGVKALEHAKWAYRNAEKDRTREYWRNVIEEIKKKVPRNLKLTEPQRIQIRILLQFGSITTYGSGQRHSLLQRLVEKGIAEVGETKYSNVFRLTDLGRNIKV